MYRSSKVLLLRIPQDTELRSLDSLRLFELPLIGKDPVKQENRKHENQGVARQGPSAHMTRILGSVWRGGQ